MLSPEEELRWRQQGYTLSKHVVLDTSKAVTDLNKHYKTQLYDSDFGNDPDLMFPSKYKSLNMISLNKEILSCAQQLLNGPVRLIQSVAWAKTCRGENNDQRHHMDYGNNTFVHPPSWNNPNAVACIVYLSSTKKCGGTTAIVPRIDNNDKWYKPPYIKMPGQNGLTFINDKDQAEYMLFNKGIDRSELYNRELLMDFDVGDILWYRHDVWHRGTPIKKGRVRYVINLAFAKPNSPLLTWNAGFTRKRYYGWMEKYISTMNNYQLFAIGFPHPLDPYWTNETIEWTRNRYESYGFDLNKYLMNSML